MLDFLFDAIIWLAGTFFRLTYLTCMIVYGCMYACVLYLCLVPKEIRRGHRRWGRYDHRYVCNIHCVCQRIIILKINKSDKVPDSWDCIICKYMLKFEPLVFKMWLCVEISHDKEVTKVKNKKRGWALIHSVWCPFKRKSGYTRSAGRQKGL